MKLLRDRAINAERDVRLLHDALVKQKSASDAFKDALRKEQVAQAATHRASLLNDDDVRDVMCSVSTGAPSIALQDFAARILSRCVRGSTAKGSLQRLNRQTPLGFSLVQRRGVEKTSSQASLRRSIRHQAARVVQHYGALPSVGDDQKAILYFLKCVAKKVECVVLGEKDTVLDAHQCVALRDHMQGSTNVLYRLSQAMKVFQPHLKLFPSQLRKAIASVEKESVIPVKSVAIANCVIDKAGNKRGVRNFYYSSSPSALLSLMLHRMFLDDMYRKSLSFSTLDDMYVVAVGFDKSDSDFVGTWRVCNRHEGNSSLCIQSFACLEGPVAENYENVRKCMGTVRETNERKVENVGNTSGEDT